MFEYTSTEVNVNNMERNQSESEITLRPSAARGRANFGWLDSRHTFSFGSYYDPRHVGFGDLLVINEDRVEPGRGFLPHGHRDMEIISYVVDGALAHEDSTRSGGVIRRGEVQVMTAGTGIRHSEMNGSQSEPVHFLQIWVRPRTGGRQPSYRQKDFGLQPGLTLLASPDGRDDSLTIGQDADLSRLLWDGPATMSWSPKRNRVWVQVIQGELRVGDQDLSTGDGLSLESVSELRMRTSTGVEALIFDIK